VDNHSEGRSLAEEPHKGQAQESDTGSKVQKGLPGSTLLLACRR